MDFVYQLYKNKKIGVLGFGVEGKETYLYLKKHKIEAVIFDKLERQVFLSKNDKFRFGNKLFLGEDYLEHLSEVELIFKTPGIPLLSPEIQLAINKGVIFTSQIELFFNQCRAKIIGVTGTKGKGTTSTLITNILRKCHKNVFLGGNIGLPAITFLDRLDEGSLAILELSSYQLQSLKKSPQIAVVLNVTQDHLDYHKSIQEYQRAKQNIVKYQTKQDTAIINADYLTMTPFIRKAKSKKLYYSKEKATNGCYVDHDDNLILITPSGPIGLVRSNELLLRGRHNLENVTAAVLASFVAGATIDSIREVVRSFHGLEHRLELVGKTRAVTYYNDSFSTTPETAIAAIKAFTEPMVLILGGSSKNSDYHKLGKIILKSNVKVIILIGETANQISDSIGPNYKGQKIFGLTKMSEIVKVATNLSVPGDIILLSPACASFGLFQDYKDRGDKFKKSVMSILHK